MVKTSRPRVAAIGLDDAQLASIEFLCGELRPSVSVDEYLSSYNWTETDVVLSNTLRVDKFDTSVSLMTIGPIYINWRFVPGESASTFAVTNQGSTERELAIPSSCPNLYKSLAADLSKQLGRTAEPPDVVSTSRRDCKGLIETTSGRPVALRLDLPRRHEDETSRPVALLLPQNSNLVAWFRAFLCDLHQSDRSRVPQAPPRLTQPSDWYTPDERALADRIAQIDSEVEHLKVERVELLKKLADEEGDADRGIRRALWALGDELKDAVAEILEDLGFKVRDMDSELSLGQPKREDLRLTLPEAPGWEAIAEVKGYPGWHKNKGRSPDSRTARTIHRRKRACS